MIKSSELRIGNLVEQKVNSDCGRYCIITAIGLLTESDIDADPIPLTPEILEKAGFKQQPKYFNNGKFTLYPYRDGFGLEIDGFTDQGINVIIKNLHQFQNLYFALTGEELEINL